MMRASRIGGLFLLAIVAALLLAVLLGAILPRNAGWRESETGVTIGIDATLAHTELILPVAAAGHNWRASLPPEVFPPGQKPTHLSFSWGERDFFLATPSWSDFEVLHGLRALFASDQSLVHIYRLDGPRGHPIRLSPAEYARLIAFLQAEIGAGTPVPGYGPDDIFLPGTSRYSAIRTCNQWVADALAEAGVKVGSWTPFAQSLIWRYDGELSNQGR